MIPTAPLVRRWRLPDRASVGEEVYAYSVFLNSLEPRSEAHGREALFCCFPDARPEHVFEAVARYRNAGI